MSFKWEHIIQIMKDVVFNLKGKIKFRYMAMKGKKRYEEHCKQWKQFE